MSKKNKPPKKVPKKRRNTQLKQHKQSGRTLSPPFMTLPNLKLVNWLKDDLPDMLWLTFLTCQYGERGPLVARKVFDTAEQLLKEHFGSLEDVPKDTLVLGRLTSFDGLPDELRPRFVERLKLLGCYDRAFPPEFSAALSRYDNPPCRWLWERPLGRSLTQDEIKNAESLLRKIIDSAWSGRNESSTLAKIAVTSALFSSGRIHITASIADDLGPLLTRYPSGLNDDEKKRVESSMRAMYQTSHAAVSEEEQKASLAWAKEFWRTNWLLYSCEIDEEPTQFSKKDDDGLSKFHAHIETRLETIRSHFLEAAEADPDIYDPTRYEVLTGIVSRMLRAVSIAVDTPTMWSTEHGSGLIRSIVEARIVLAWLLTQNDPDLFIKFQNYGRGHLKLLKLQLEEFLDKQDEPNPDLEAYLEALDAEVNQDISEEFQEIQAGGHFAGNMDTRKMADAVGLGNDYRFIFAPASSSFHNEWTAIDQFGLERCLNPLHKGHRISKKDSSVIVAPQLIELALDQLQDLVDRYAADIDIPLE